MTSSVRAVFRKELFDSLRDRRSILAALIMPIAGPALFAGMFTFMAKKHSSEKPLELPVVGAEHAPSLIGYLKRQGVVIQPAPEAPEARVRDGKLDLVLEIPEEFGEDFTAGRPARVLIIMDESRDTAKSSIRRTQLLLERYAAELAALRLIARGVSPDLVRPVRVEEVDLSTPQRVAARLLALIPYFALLAAFAGGMNVAIDTTAGERERGSLEPLLINPVPRLSLVTGKWLTTSMFGVVVTLLTLIGFSVATRIVPLEELGVVVEFGPVQILGLLAVVIPLAFFAAALMMTVATFARSFKEAQTYLSVMMFLPMLPAIVLMLNPIKTKLWMLLVPIFSQTVLVNDVMRGERIEPLGFAAASVMTLLLALVTLAIAARLYQQERVIFGR